MKAGSHLGKTYITAIPRIVYRSTISLLLDPKGSQRFVHQVLNAQDLESDDPVLGGATITDILNIKGLLLENAIDVQIIGSYYVQCSSDVRQILELASLAFIMKVIKPKLVFELGTFIGRTTRLFAINSPRDCQIITIDLEFEHVECEVGEAFKGMPGSDKIKQLYGDSRSFDFSPWYGLCDFVWVDACHDYDYVVSDTQNALKLCRPGGVDWMA